jgi:hypothetical protein
MPLDAPKKGESLEDYLNYCIPVEIQAGKEQAVATAICISTYKKQEMSKLRTSQERFTAKLNYSQQFRGVNLMAAGLEDACWPGWTAVGTKELDGRTVPNCVPDPNEELEVQPMIDSSYPGQGPTTASLQEQEINVFGYNTKHFSICPGAIGLFTHIQEMPMEDDTVGMIRSAAQIADNVFRIEKEVIARGKAETSQLNEVELLVDDFKDLMQEIDEEVDMIHDVSFMDGHIQVVKDLV